MRTRGKLALASLLPLVALAPVSAQGRSEWRKDCDACIGYYTAGPAEVHCPGDYAATYPECLTGGGRACLMTKAVASAKAGDCEKAFKLTLICQCHDGTAQDRLKAAGKQDVCDYLRTK